MPSVNFLSLSPKLHHSVLAKTHFMWTQIQQGSISVISVLSALSRPNPPYLSLFLFFLSKQCRSELHCSAYFKWMPKNAWLATYLTLPHILWGKWLQTKSKQTLFSLFAPLWKVVLLPIKYSNQMQILKVPCSESYILLQLALVIHHQLYFILPFQIISQRVCFVCIVGSILNKPWSTEH